MGRMKDYYLDTGEEMPPDDGYDLYLVECEHLHELFVAAMAPDDAEMTTQPEEGS